MKIKHLFIFGLVALLFFSCNPNKKLYEELDAARVPYNEQISYTLTDDDYTIVKNLALETATNETDSNLANDLALYKSFSATRNAQSMIPAFLETSFIALDSGSSVMVTFNYSNKYNLESPQIPGSFSTYEEVAAAIPVEEDDEIGDLLYPEFSYTGSKAITKAVFEFDGTSWALPFDTYELQDADYESMGISDHYFSDSYVAEDYLPTFINLKYPYAQINDTARVVYFSGAFCTADFYIFDGQVWNNIEEKSAQFIHSGTAWAFDPTVYYSMVSSDYQIIVDWIINNDSLSNYVGYDNKREFYFGSNAKYSDFNMLVSQRTGSEYDPNGYLDGLTDEEVSTILFDRLIFAVKLVLDADFPDAVPFVNGIPVYYEISLLTFEPSTKTYVIKFLCTDTGTFEYVEGPTLVE